MNKIPDKKLQRLEKKKKKLHALINIVTLNEIDKCAAKPETSPDVQDTSDGCSAVKKLKVGDASNSVPIDKTDTMVPSKNLNEDYQTLKAREKKIVRERKKPNLVLKVPGQQASLSTYVEDRVPILFTDLQHLLLNSTLGNKSPYLPLRWCHLEKSSRISHTVVAILEGISLYDFCANESLATFGDRFTHRLEVVTPSCYDGCAVDEIAAVPLTDLEKNSLILEYGSMDAAMEARKDLMVMMRAIFPVSEGARPLLSSDNIRDNFSRTQLVLSAWQLVEHNYPLPLKGKLTSTYCDYVFTKDLYEPVTASSPLYGIDCEMCLSEVGHELTRITVLDENYEVAYESFVLPRNQIKDYLTMYSGITEETLSGVKTRLEDVQKALRELLPPDAILVGQSLNFDLHAMKMMHPYIIDTSVIFNTSGDRTRKTKLKNLAKQFLKKNIQVGNKGHCSLEDAVTCLKLVKLKLSKTLAYGDAILKGKQKSEEHEHLKKRENEYSTNIFNQVIPKNGTCFISGPEDVVMKYDKYLKQFYDNNENKDKIKINRTNDNLSIVDGICEHSKRFTLTVGHMSFVNREQSEPLNIFPILNDWIERIWNSVESNCLFLLILAGSRECNGIAFINVKK